MAIIKNNRVYLECTDVDTYFKEILEVSKLNLEKHVTIWDQSKQESYDGGEELYDVYLDANRIDDTGGKIFDRRIWARLVKLNLVRSKYVEVGCWKNEEELINEIKNNFAIINIDEHREQIEFFLKIDNFLGEYFIDESINKEGRIKWFNFALYDNIKKDFLTFNSSHFGEEYYINKLDKEEVENIVLAVENNDIYVRVNRHNARINEY